MGFPCDYYFKGRKLTYDQFRKELKGLPMSEIEGMFPTIKDEGIKSIAWTTGAQQNERYDLSKQVDFIDVFTNDDGTYHIVAVKGNNTISEEKSLKENQLEGLLGKDLTNKIIEDTKNHTHREGEENLVKTYRGKDLSVGGKGMKGFYGSPTEGSLGIVGNVAKSLFKQEPKTTTIKGGKGSIDATSVDAIWVEDNGKILPENKREDYKFNDNEFVFTIDNNVAYRLYDKNDIKDAKNRDVYTIPRGNYFTQHSIDITPELKVQVEEQGQSLFQEIETKKNQALKAIANYATKALDKNPDMSYKEFESRLISHPITEQLVKDLTPKAVKAIFRDKKGNTDADERGVNPKNTRKNSYTDRAVDQASANISAEMNELKRTRDVTNLSAQKEVADKIFDSMLNSPNPTATFEGFNKLIGITTSSNPNDIAIDSMIMQKIRHYYADT